MYKYYTKNNSFMNKCCYCKKNFEIRDKVILNCDGFIKILPLHTFCLGFVPGLELIHEGNVKKRIDSDWVEWIMLVESYINIL